MKKRYFLCLVVILAVAIVGTFYVIYLRRKIEPEIDFDVRFTNDNQGDIAKLTNPSSRA